MTRSRLPPGLLARERIRSGQSRRVIQERTHGEPAFPPWANWGQEREAGASRSSSPRSARRWARKAVIPFVVEKTGTSVSRSRAASAHLRGRARGRPSCGRPAGQRPSHRPRTELQTVRRRSRARPRNGLHHLHGFPVAVPSTSSWWKVGLAHAIAAGAAPEPAATLHDSLRGERG
jgi:hypothetical protein